MLRWLALAFAVVFLAGATPASAQGSNKPVRVAVRILPPFVEQKPDGTMTGFSVELWNAAAQRMKRETKFIVVPDVSSQLDAVRKGKADVGVGAISITAERNFQFDFSQPILNAGLQILVRAERAGAETTALETLVRLLTSKAMLVWLGIAFLLAIIPAHIVWFLERNHEEGIVRSKKYIPGIFQALAWSFAALMTQADAMPRHWLARAFASLWIFSGVVFVAFYTAQLTAALTVEQFRSEISGPADLPGKPVGTIKGSTSAQFLKANGVADAQTFEKIDDAYQALLDKKIDAVVFDAPVLQYYASHAGADTTRVTGPVFHPEDYGFALANGSPLRKEIDTAILDAREDGSYEDLTRKWFGAR